MLSHTSRYLYESQLLSRSDPYVLTLSSELSFISLKLYPQVPLSFCSIILFIHGFFSSPYIFIEVELSGYIAIFIAQLDQLLS